MQSQVSLKPQLNLLLSTDEKVGKRQTILESACTSLALELTFLNAPAVLMRPNEWNKVVFQTKKPDLAKTQKRKSFLISIKSSQPTSAFHKDKKASLRGI